MLDRVLALGLGDRDHPKEIDAVAVKFEFGEFVAFEIWGQEQIQG